MTLALRRARIRVRNRLMAAVPLIALAVVAAIGVLRALL